MIECPVRVAQWRLSPLRSWVRFPVKPIPHWHVIERETFSDSAGFLRGLRFPPTCIANRPILSMELIMLVKIGLVIRPDYLASDLVQIT
jgi:hypothetical protein